MTKCDPPEKFSFKAEEWKIWLKEFRRFRSCSKLYKEPEEQRDALFYTMGNKEAEKIFNTFKFEGMWPKPKADDTGFEDKDQSEKDFECVEWKFTNHFIPAIMKWYERSRFTERNQQPGEPFEHFLRDINSLITTRQYTDENDMLLDRIVQGIHSNEVRKKLGAHDGLDHRKGKFIHSIPWNGWCIVKPSRSEGNRWNQLQRLWNRSQQRSRKRKLMGSRSWSSKSRSWLSRSRWRRSGIHQQHTQSQQFSHLWRLRRSAWWQKMASKWPSMPLS